MRSGHPASCPSVSLTAQTPAWARVGLACASLAFVVVAAGSGRAEGLTAKFRQEDYANPQPSQPIFAETWPGLIAANNEAHAKGFLHNGPSPGKNSSLVLNNAVLTIPGGRIVASINSGLYSGCHTGSLSQDNAAHAFSCPARVTIYKDGQARTIDAGFLCRVGGDTPNSAAEVSYDPASKVLQFFAVIGGARVPFSNTDEPCDRTLSLAR
jgi:hypothetical protein